MVRIRDIRQLDCEMSIPACGEGVPEVIMTPNQLSRSHQCFSARRGVALPQAGGRSREGNHQAAYAGGNQANSRLSSILWCIRPREAGHVHCASASQRSQARSLCQRTRRR